MPTIKVKPRLDKKFNRPITPAKIEVVMISLPTTTTKTAQKDSVQKYTRPL